MICPASESTAASLVTVHPTPIVFEVEVGQVKSLNIVLENAVDVYGIDVQGQFDINAIEVVDANPGRSGIQMIPGVIPKPDFVVINSADNLNGTFRYAVTQINPTPPASGNGVIFSIRVRGKMISESALTFTSVQMADQDATPLPVTPQNGTVRVVLKASVFSFFLPIIEK